MAEEKELIPEKNTEKGMSRRQFLAGTGIALGGAALGSMTLLSACGKETTVTTTVAQSTTTVTSPPTTVTVTGTGTAGKYVDPYSGQQFDTLEALKAYLDQTRPVSSVPLTTLKVNGVTYILADLEPNMSLAYVLREKLSLVGTKMGCNRGECGTCTLIMNGKTVYSCMVLAVEAEGAEITTIEGLSNGITFTGVLKAMYDNDSLQCGYCAPGFIMSAVELLTAKPQADPGRGPGSPLGASLHVRQHQDVRRRRDEGVREEMNNGYNSSSWTSR